jgi:hypothetical protein
MDKFQFTFSLWLQKKEEEEKKNEDKMKICSHSPYIPLHSINNEFAINNLSVSVMQTNGVKVRVHLCKKDIFFLKLFSM